MVLRVVINDLRPTTPDRVSAAKAVVERPLHCSANVFADGHDDVAARVRWRPAGARTWRAVPMTPLGNDRWTAIVVPDRIGAHEFVIDGWVDLHSTWRRRIRAKIEAGQDVAAEREEGARLIEATVALADGRAAASLDNAAAAIEALRSGDPEPAFAPELAAALSAISDPTVTTTSPRQRLWVDRERAAVGAWYELFPRSYGGLAGATARLDAVADMGFDVVYVPPVHPIGTTARKGPGNTLVARPGDPGSPWAIGSAAGGHTAVEPSLGTLEDFDRFVATAEGLGLDVAMDYALQCSPDHPWVHEHPEWFYHRPDGTIRFAENPPKQYQDIYPIDFTPPDDRDREALWAACRDVMEFWIERGIRIFRVDNPHTKPFAFWAWLLSDVRTRHPEVVFLAEAFTRPRVMERLAEIGFSQSYTYFTWRTTKDELAAYADELAHGAAADYFRPNLWPNTPDILSGPLRYGPLGAFKMRAALAAMLGPAWGVYSGYELGENVPASDANEEYAASEKYQLVTRHWDVPWSLAPYLKRLNDIRRRHPAVTNLSSLRVEYITDPQMLAFSKHVGSDVVLVVVNLDPMTTREATLWIDLGALGLPWDAPLEAQDELGDQRFLWRGPEPYVRLAPDEPAHVIALRPAT